MHNRFLTYRLGDNDFGSDMDHAMKWMIDCVGLEFLKDLPDQRILAAMANHMAGEVMARSVLQGHDHPEGHGFAWYLNYFYTAKIDRTDDGAHADGNSSYVSVDLATGYIWRH